MPIAKAKPTEAEKIKDLEFRLQEQLLTRWERYQKVQDLQVDAITTRKAVTDGLKKATSNVNRTQNEINKLKLDIGVPKSQIEAEDRRRIMNPN